MMIVTTRMTAKTIIKTKIQTLAATDKELGSRLVLTDEAATVTAFKMVQCRQKSRRRTPPFPIERGHAMAKRTFPPIIAMAFVGLASASTPIDAQGLSSDESTIAGRLLSSRGEPVGMRCRFSPGLNGTLTADCNADRLARKTWLDDHGAIADKALSLTGTASGLYTASNLATKESAALALRSVTSNESLIERAAPQLLRLAKSPASRGAMLGAMAVGASIWIYESYESLRSPEKTDSIRLLGVVHSP